jgi:hypothetical protein
VSRLTRIRKMMSVAGSSPVLWVNVKSLLGSGPYAAQNMRLWNEALVAACREYPNMRVYDWAGAVRDGWFTSDGTHFNTPGYTARESGAAATEGVEDAVEIAEHPEGTHPQARIIAIDGEEKDFYIRQLWDAKGSAEIETMNPSDVATYGTICGWTLARAHARSGDPIAISAYLGSSETFDQALATFAEVYADQNERDHAALQAAATSGRIKAEMGV